MNSSHSTTTEMIGIRLLPNELKHLVISHSVTALIATLFTFPLNPFAVEPTIRRHIRELLTALPGVQATIFVEWRDQLEAYRMTTNAAILAENHLWKDAWQSPQTEKVRRLLKRWFTERSKIVRKLELIASLAHWVMREVTLVAADLVPGTV